VGPDNGLLLPAASRAGIAEAHELANPAYALESISRTFHGRDLFSPAAAHLANGVALAELGPPVDPDGLVRLDLPEPIVTDGAIQATLLYVDSFGNIALNLDRDDVGGLSILLWGTSARASGRALLRVMADVVDAGRAMILSRTALKKMSLAISRERRILHASPGRRSDQPAGCRYSSRPAVRGDGASAGLPW
jgi:S-adenosylmethionine hydrolase